MTIEQLIKQLQQFNPKAEITINCPDTSITRSIWYVDSDFGDEDNYVDIVMQKFEDEHPNFNFDARITKISTSRGENK